MIVEQLRGNYKVKNKGLKPLHMQARMLVVQIGTERFDREARAISQLTHLRARVAGLTSSQAR